MKSPEVTKHKPFKGRSRRARKRREAREEKHKSRKFGYVDRNDKFHATIRLRAGDNLTEELLKQAIR